jgi:hypothetical protein
MALDQKKLEREFFRRLNSVVEPAVRLGIGSPRCLPAGLILLESTGFKSGQTRRTPLLATRILGHVVVSTVRGDSSFWVKNLQKKPGTTYWRGGREQKAKAFVMMPGKRYRSPQSLPDSLRKLTDLLAPLTEKGFAFAVLAPTS